MLEGGDKRRDDPARPPELDAWRPSSQDEAEDPGSMRPTPVLDTAGPGASSLGSPNSPANASVLRVPISIGVPKLPRRRRGLAFKLFPRHLTAQVPNEYSIVIFTQSKLEQQIMDDTLLPRRMLQKDTIAMQ